MKTSSPLGRILLGIGAFLATSGFSYSFDYFVYPIVTYYFGLTKSLIILFLAALVLNYFVVLLYDVFKKDFFGFEALKEMKRSGNGKGIMYTIMKWGDVPFFIFLSWYDPIFAVLYKRKSSQFDGFKKQDYFILVLSTAIGCFIWSCFWSLGIELIKYIFPKWLS